MLAAWPASAMTRKVYVALERCEMLLEDIDPTIQLKAAHGVFQGTSAYAKVLEVGTRGPLTDARGVGVVRREEYDLMRVANNGLLKAQGQAREKLLKWYMYMLERREVLA